MMTPTTSYVRLDLLEQGWKPSLRLGTRAAELDVEPEVLRALARALGGEARGRSPSAVAARWPACVVVALARTFAGRGDSGIWPAWHRAAGTRMTKSSAAEWGKAFLGALAALGLPRPDSAEIALADQGTPLPEEAENGEPGTDLPAPGAGLRLEPFGRGVLDADGDPAGPGDAVDPDDPVLVFGEDGEPAGPVLPAAPAWIVYPMDAGLSADVPLRVLLASRLPLTWRGWKLEQVDLRDVAWIGLDTGPGPDARPGRRRIIRGRVKPVLVAGAPLAGVTAAGASAGAPVFAGLPRVLLPPGRGTWRVEARRVSSGAVLASIAADGDTWRPEVMWQKIPRPVLGEIAISATSGQGEAGLRRSVIVAERLRVSFFPGARLTRPLGLEEAEAVVTVPEGMTVSPSAMPFGETDVTREFSCVAGPVVQRLRITPPHLRMRLEPEPGGGGTPGPWQDAGPFHLAHSDLLRGGFLRLDLPEAPDPLPPLRVAPAGAEEEETAQLLHPSRQCRYPLRRLLDTVTAIGAADLKITVAARTSTVATVTPPEPGDDPWLA